MKILRLYKGQVARKQTSTMVTPQRAARRGVVVRIWEN